MKLPPGTEQPKRFRPKLRYELIGCGLNGHELLGTNAKTIRQQDALFAFENDNIRWYRCLRCDSWLVMPKPSAPDEDHPPERENVTVPLRGKPLRDRYVLRVIAIDRGFHFVVLSLLAIVIFLFAAHAPVLKNDYSNLLTAYRNVNGNIAQGGLLNKINHVFSLPKSEVLWAGTAVLAYALLEGAEMIGLWFAKRWAEYLTFLATIVFLPYEIIELVHKPSVLKVITFAINIAIALYLLYAKRLFGLRGGGKKEAAERARDMGWPAIERASEGLLD